MANAPIIGGLFRTPSAPAPVATPAVASPTQDPTTQKKVQDAADEARKNAGQGAASDILTGGAGLDPKSQKTSSNVLLGS